MDLDDPGATPPRPISEKGEYVFFDTSESLLPQDTNGKLDVYEWHDGAISSISSGQSSSDDFFLDSSPDGRNVFFGTHSALVLADNDSEGDLYDARIDGGFPAPLGAGPCEGDACQPAAPLPLFQTPATNTLASGGNLASEPPPPPVKTVTRTVTCKKGFVKKKVKTKTECVKPKKKGAKPHKARRGSNGGRIKS